MRTLQIAGKLIEWLKLKAAHLSLTYIILYILPILLLTACQIIGTAINDSITTEAPSPSNVMTIESQPNGIGTEIKDKNLKVGETLNIYAIERDFEGIYIKNIDVSWELIGGVGNLNALSIGQEAEYQASSIGASVIKITANGNSKNLNITVTALVSNFNHGGWNDVVALGPKTNASNLYIQPIGLGTPSTNIVASDMRITLSWNDFLNDTEEGYQVFRSTVSGGQDLFNPIVTINNSGTTTYTDTNIIPATVYYYIVRPLISGLAYSTSEPYSEIKITVPPNNMGLVHRWVANQEVCGLMSKATDPLNNYRCIFTGQGNIGGFYDLGYDLLVDRFESGCNITQAACTGGSLGLGPPLGCTAADAPTGTIVAAVGSVYYKNDDSTCFVNTDGATNWQSAAGASPSELASMTSSKAHLPPLVRIDQVESYTACGMGSLNIDDGGTILPYNKRLLRQKEWRAASAWSASLSDMTIESIEADADTDGHCNTDFSNSNTRDHSENLTVADQALLTGSQATSDMGTGQNKCVSRYGMQDMVGNVWEWTSDQCNFAGGICTAPGTPLDVANIDIFGWTLPVASGVLLSTLSDFSVALGIPLVGAEDGSIDNTTFGAKFHGDYFYDDFGNAGMRGLLVGGPWIIGGSFGGRWDSSWFNGPATDSNVVSLRCATPLP